MSASIVLVVLAGLLAAVQAQPAVAAIAGIFGPDCPDVMVIAARGSGEQPQADWSNPAAYGNDPYHGAGHVNTDLYDRLRQAAPQLRFSLDPVEYAADAVWPDLATGISIYASSVETGASRILTDINLLEHACSGRVQYLFTGYSQGAWAMHKALHMLSNTILDKVVGVALFGDPMYDPGKGIDRDTNPLLLTSGSAYLIDGSNVGVPAALESVTGSYCLFNDPVCQFNGNIGNASTSLPWCVLAGVQHDFNESGPCPHLHYVTEGETAKAAQFLIPKLPSATNTVTTNLPGELGVCGTGNTWTFALSGVGGNTGIDAPASIVATLSAGGTTNVPLARVIGANPSGFSNTAYYELTTSGRLTGHATAVIAHAWDPHNFFRLQTGPCTGTKLTITASSTAVMQGNQVTVTGRLTTSGGFPLAIRSTNIRLHSQTRLGKGQVFRDLMTDTDGRFSVTVTADDPWLSFTAEYGGSGPTVLAESEALAVVVVWTMPLSPPSVSSGTLASSVGATFTPTVRTTVVSGGGFAPNADIGILIHSEPALLATTTADNSGAFQVEGTIPDELAGDHTLVAMGEQAIVGDQFDGPVTRYLTLPVTISGPAESSAPAQNAAPRQSEGRLALTGTPILTIAVTGIVLLIVGASLWLLRRRRFTFSAEMTDEE